MVELARIDCFFSFAVAVDNADTLAAKLARKGIDISLTPLDPAPSINTPTGASHWKDGNKGECNSTLTRPQRTRPLR